MTVAASEFAVAVWGAQRFELNLSAAAGAFASAVVVVVVSSFAAVAAGCAQLETWGTAEAPARL
jgi:hypothetical protein